MSHKQYDGLGMRPMRPHCVKYVVLLNCVSLCTLFTMCPVMYGRCGCVLFVCDIGGTHNDMH